MPLIKPTPSALTLERANELAARLNKDEETELNPWKYTVALDRGTYYVEIHDEDGVRLGYL